MNMFRRERAPARASAQTPEVPPRPTPQDLENPVTHSIHKQDTATEQTQRSGVMGVMQKVNPFKSSSAQPPSGVCKAPSSESLENCTGPSAPNPGGFRGVMHKVNPFKSTSQSQVSKAPSSESLDQEKSVDVNQNPGAFKGVIQKVNPFKTTTQNTKNDMTSDNVETPESENEPQTAKQNPGVMSGMMQKVNPFKSSSQAPKNDSTESQATNIPQTKQNPRVFSGMIQKVNPFKSQPKDPKLVHSDLSGSEGSLTENNNLPDKKISTDENAKTPDLPPRPEQQNQGVFKGMMQKVNPFKSSSSQVPSECQTDSAPKRLSAKTQAAQGLESSSSSSCESLNDETIQPHSIWYTDAVSTEVQPEQPRKKRTMTFRLKRILPTGLFGSGAQNSAASEVQAQTQEAVQIETLEFADVNSEETALDPLDDEDGLLSWWNTVEGWNEWNESKQDAEAEDVVEQAADRVFMAARLFVRLFNKRGGSLQQKILELLSMADAADSFHKKTVTASVGGGVASVAGSITTITGLILAPFTAGTSLIVTAVGIGVATAGGIASASANITDTVHSKTDRKKVEKMIQDYQDEIKDIKECLDFVQEGMETLEEWNFEQYAEAISKKHLNQNVKHVMKEGGRAGKALVINTESLINTVQVLSVAGGAAKAAQVMSVTTGVMSGLFLALDVFFLAKDSIELKQGAKTDFAVKIREVCKDLQSGLLELNRIKEDLQKTMDGIEVEIEEEEDEELLKSDLKKLIELEE
ncbi:hypothetical protein NL108_005417 [Boleophthalmus pectinirostris]|uniref:uncharacterized protein apold1b isoform X2 n=1 Tax=Boleophthalmus pectinirostris TaxID=150288 RepID=UPI00242EC574|nr:uncharacterized protein apold1b isoform X2 [Boleophthalmus pectinirostris]KAJ0055565.1 hypothetical protein NL108_005417 [Boleophthalmus pectinirostris]